MKCLSSGVGGGCKHTANSFDLSKIQAESLKIRVNMGKIRDNFATSLKIWAKMEPNVVWFEKNGAQRLRIHIMTFFWKLSQKRSSCSLWEKIVAQNLFGEVWGNWTKILRTPEICLLLHLYASPGHVQELSLQCLCTSLDKAFLHLLQQCKRWALPIPRLLDRRSCQLSRSSMYWRLSWQISS